MLALDISANFLSAIPPTLAQCINLEELNIASNPLRALPTFLSTLTNLRVLIVDSTGISTLPANLAALERLHTLSIRRNKMHSLPSWLCVLPALETLLVDGNPFQGPWKALMEPLLSRGPLSPTYAPSTPMFPPPSASIRSTMTSATTDVDDTPEPLPSADRATHEDEDVTVTSPRAPNLARSITAPIPQTSTQLPSPGLSRTRTTPNRAYFDKSRTSSNGPKSMFSEAGPSNATSRGAPDPSDREVRKMKSAGELRRNYGGSMRGPSTSVSSSPQRPALTEYVTSASSSNLLNMATPAADSQGGVPRRFASLGVAAGAAGALSPTSSSRSRRTVDSSIWDSPTEEETGVEPVPPLPMNKLVFPQEGPVPMDQALPPRLRAGDKDKSSRWGFLKKMSMGKMRPDSPQVSRTSMHGGQIRQPHSVQHPHHQQLANVPAIDVRISTTGTLLQEQPEVVPPSLSRKASADLLKISPLDQLKKNTNEAAKLAPVNAGNGLLVPQAGPTSRANKRRSFLPIDMSPIPIPNASEFVPGVTATDGSEEPAEELPAPSPVHVESYEDVQRREEERAREARIRALRSVMSYLRDMHDLSQSQSQTLSLYGGIPQADSPQSRSRRPTLVDGGRIPSEMSMSMSSMSSSAPPSRPESVNLRSTEGRNVMSRNGNTTQTNSVATTDSGGSAGGEERKYKDDKAKRARVIREIVECVCFIS